MLNGKYLALLEDIKKKVLAAQHKAAFSLNKELIFLYWDIGNKILSRQRIEGWGSKVVDRLSKDLVSTFPGMSGFSTRNLKYMRKFAEEYPNIGFVQGTLAQLTWYHNITLMDKVKDRDIRKWYVTQAINHGWSRDVLVMQIETRLHKRQGGAVDNFREVMPKQQSDLARAVLKDPYIFDFLTVSQDARERRIEDGLVDHITRFLLELGAGFAYVGRQFHLEIDGDDFYIDLLFYHLRLRCFIAIELKAGEFRPEYVGKVNFYLSALDDMKHKDDRPSIGLILCKTKSRIVAEYALKSVGKPIGVSAYRLSKSVPSALKDALPSIDDIEKELSKKVKLH
jgi:predicted nuclease of restriction endonuclease-like (RecB) superfamily